MNTPRYFTISIASGMAAAMVLVAINYLVVNPHVEELEFEYINLKLAEGLYIEEEIDSALRAHYFWQTALPIIMGIGAGVLVATTYVKKGSRGFMVGLAVSSAAWFSLYIMPVLKYPLVPDMIFDHNVAGEYIALFAGYSICSGLVALGTTIGFAKTGKKNWYVGAAGVYLAIIAGLYMAFPAFPESEFYSSLILDSWRSASAAGVTAFWFTLGILAGALFEREEKKDAREKDLNP